MAEAPKIRVTVVVAEPEQQRCVSVLLAGGATVAEAVAASGLLDARKVPPASAGAAFGVYGRLVDPQHVLEDRDRVEILRPLLQDPKSRRRRRAREGRTMGAAAAGERKPACD